MIQRKWLKGEDIDAERKTNESIKKPNRMGKKERNVIVERRLTAFK